MANDNYDFEYYGVSEIMSICHCSKNKAYKIIKQLNEMALQNNPETIIIKGKAKSEYVRRYMKE